MRQKYRTGNTVVFSISLDRTLLKTIDQIAEYQDINRSQLIAESLEAYAGRYLIRLNVNNEVEEMELVT